MLHKHLGGLEAFLADCAGGDSCSTGKLRRDRKHSLAVKNCFLIELHFLNLSFSHDLSVKLAADYFVFLSTPMVCDATGELSVAGGTPALHISFFLSANTIKG